VAGNHHFLSFMLLMEGDESQDIAQVNRVGVQSVLRICEGKNLLQCLISEFLLKLFMGITLVLIFFPKKPHTEDSGIGLHSTVAVTLGVCICTCRSDRYAFYCLL
jgi:hypothetical protein